MNELKLRPLKCPKCGAAGVVREGTRITNCERCGVRLCLTEIATSRYEVTASLSAAGATARARAFLESRNTRGVLGRPELVLVPFHELSALRVGVFDRKVPYRKRAQRTTYAAPGGGATVESWVYGEKDDTKVMIADVQHLEPAAKTPWDLRDFDAREARRRGTLEPFDIAEAQRRATVYAEEETAVGAAERRFGEGENIEVVALARRTLFFPFWLIPLEAGGGSFEIVIDGVLEGPVAWRLPQPYPSTVLTWAMLAAPGALLLGLGLKALTQGAPAFIDPVTSTVLGAAATGAALWKANKPDWALSIWPEAGG